MIEKTIFSNLLYNESYCRRVFPYIKEDYFDDIHLKVLYDSFKTYVDQYKESPSKEALQILIENRDDLNEDSFKKVNKLIDELSVDSSTNEEWLVSTTEKFCQDKDIFNAVRKCILILDEKDGNADRGSIPKILSDSLSISFDTHIGHSFIEDYESRFDEYHRVESRIPFDIDYLNKVTKGGLPPKSMTLFMSATGGGKTLTKCHIAAAAMMQGKKVLYITNEMAEERIAERIDSNLLDITIDDLKQLDKEIYKKRIQRIKNRTFGDVIIKEYPPGSAHSGHYRHLINDLRLKKNFSPDIIIVDYLNICASARIKNNGTNSYSLIKSVAEELRGLAVEFNCALITSSQYNRSGYGTSDVDLTSTSESMGTTHTADAIFGIINSEELDEMGQIMFKQLKNRWGDINYYRRFLVGIDRAKMKLYNLEESAQQNIQNETVEKPELEYKMNKKKPSLKAEGIK